ncbi:DUF1858 domain-containing protein [Mesorhizobium sp. A623]
MTIDEVMRRWPPTIRVILRNHMLCVGCPVASFHTVSDAAREHGLDETQLRQELEAVISSCKRSKVIKPSPGDLRRA